MQLWIADAELFLDTCHTRLPFRFGMHTLTQAPLALLRLTVEVPGGNVQGYASDLLVPKWFEKNPDLTPEQDVARLVESATQAIEASIGARGKAFDLWHRVFKNQMRHVPPHAPDALVHGWGASLLERACIDAACRAVGHSFAEALQTDLLGLDLTRLDPEVEGWTPAMLAPPADTITLRHTVGMLDVLRESDLPSSDRIDDGLPETLEADIKAHGLTCFKLKCCGDVSSDVERLEAIASLLQEHVGESARVTIDGNEQFESIEDVLTLMHTLDASSHGRWLRSRLLLIEQPLPRTVTFDPHRNQGIDRLGAPVIIDEADGSAQALPEAASLGYGGTSIKNCKGVFHALLNKARCDLSGGSLFLSGEDLTNLPVIALQQDLCTNAALGIEHVERNGHHYFRGLDHLPQVDVESALHHHGDLYRAGGVHIDRGRLHIGSLQCSGYGYAPEPCCDARTLANAWYWAES
ncbi:MAG: hypothetical protein MK101_08550 [Phycisphaerales bacterium]|nr:hypothetical protein [Phycisphaerales bacterium]